MRGERITVALAGNPNAGKTTVFNALTGGGGHVGNYPGVTVELRTGRARRGQTDVRVVDLPGTYSLTAYSAEEVVARRFILDEKPDVVVDVLDTANLERNLYLATQLLELGVPLVLAFNKADLAEARGYRIDTAKLAKLLGVPIVSTIGHKGKGTDELLAAALEVARDPGNAVERQQRPAYGRELDPEVAKLAALAADDGSNAVSARWRAVKLLENDAEVVRQTRAGGGEAAQTLLAEARASRRHIRTVCGDSAEIILADRRYGFISGACQEAVRSTVETRHELSDRIDRITTNRFLGLPLFLLMTMAVFYVTFRIGMPLSDVLDAGKGHLAGRVAQLWPKGAEAPLRSLLVDGVLGGVGAVVVFVPTIFVLFLAIAILEDSGYMARAAFVMDRLMHRIGLHGKSFIPMLIGFGCTVPAVMATRTLENKRDRLTTMMVLPLFSCSARLPIYVLILGTFFPARKVFGVLGIVDVTNQMLWMMAIYLIGIVLAVIAARILRSTLFAGDMTGFVMELPPYRMPTLRGALIHTWMRTWMFLRKAGTVILAASIVMWMLTSYPKAGADPAADAGRRDADRVFLSEMKQLDTVSPDGTGFEAVGRATLAYEHVRREHWDHTPQVQAARKELQARLTDLARMSPVIGRLVQPAGGVREEPGRRTDALIARGYAEAVDRWKRAVAEIDHRDGSRRLEHSVAGRVGKAIAPVLAPCGFDWRIATSLIGAAAAKEVFVAQMGVVFSVGDAEAGGQALRERIHAAYGSGLIGFCIMLFCLISLPCVATLAATWRESGSIRWALLQAGGLTALAWVVTTAVYQVGRLVS
ncbi:MAG TPA: ferrous iron transport protein B [Phycisphaerae bacterium]|nr:ferrous iron transport protein B [Phycisphaerae bacterium]